MANIKIPLGVIPVAVASSNYTEETKGEKISSVNYTDGLYAPLLLPWVKRFAADDRLMVMKFNEVFDSRIFDEVLRFAGVEDSSVDAHYEDFIRNKSPTNKGAEMPLDPTIRLYLKFLYQPFDKFLVQLLGEEWEGWYE
ncbi:hypothetical protein QTG54_010437 [Skeletonema marinoi]|uniref:Uncharacterized protein n=1 Tax=Skeletonema marinoi TaxID=267567 RepID=A0AAD9D9E4_9STRA|nr:hypothetical protein QTG54_010437 [Skeletonema marinoi]